MGNEIAWLLLVALFALAFGVYLTVRRQLSRGELCALTIWGGWLVVAGLVFSYMGGVVHPYYTVALAPAIAALVGMGGVWAWRRRAGWDGRLGLGAMMALGAGSSTILLQRNNFNPTWIGLILVLAVVGAVGVLVARPRTVGVAVVIGALAGLAGATSFPSSPPRPHTMARYRPRFASRR
jgi:4-amino-4-deoxy-L-arabinose transferase-like glycosyltransferase